MIPNKPINLNHISSDRLPKDQKNEPLERIQTKADQMREAFLAAQIVYPEFPEGNGALCVIDAEAVKFLNQLLQQRVGPLSMREWMDRILQEVSHHKDDIEVKAEYVIGGSANATASRKLLLKGIWKLVEAGGLRSGNFHKQLERRAQRTQLNYADVDIQINLLSKSGTLRSLGKALEKIVWPESVKVEVTPFVDYATQNVNFIMILISDPVCGERLDLVLYTSKSSPYLVTLDSLRVRIPRLTDPQDQLFYDCPYFWNWWKAHIFNEIHRPESLVADQYLLERIFGLECRKGATASATLIDRANEAFLKRFDPNWTLGLKVLQKRISDHLANHESSEIGKQLYILRYAFFFRDQPPLHVNLDDLFTYVANQNLNSKEGHPFLYQCIEQLKLGGEGSKRALLAL